MKILSNFDTRLAKKLKADYCGMFGEEKVIVVHRSKFYYYVYIGFPAFLYVVALVIAAYLIFAYASESIAAWIAFSAVFVFIGLGLFMRLRPRYVDYKMDFLIVTPTEVIKYDQTGIFTRSIEKIHADKLKTITINKEGFVNSFFDIGTLIFLAEGDKEEGDIIMQFVDSIEATERKMLHVLGLDKSGA